MAELGQVDLKNEDIQNVAGIVGVDTSDGYEYLSQPLIAHCWPLIFSFVPNSDQLAARYASPAFNEMLENQKPELLFPSVVGVLTKSKYLSPSTILTCRLISKPVKASVDEALTQLEPTWMYRAFAFDDKVRYKNSRWVDGETRIEGFSKYVEAHKGNPFLTRRLSIDVEDEDLMYEGAFTLLTKAGFYLQKLELTLFFEREPLPLMERLISALDHLPNLRSLSLRFPNHHISDSDEWNKFKLVPADTFPPLLSISELRLRLEEFGDMDCHSEPPCNEFPNSIMRAYGSQLKTLVTPPNFLSGNDRQINFINTHLAGLQHLEVVPNREDPWYNYCVYEALLKLRFPHLESLKYGEFDFEENNYGIDTVLFTRRMEKYRKRVLLDKIVNELLQRDREHLEIRNFPLLKKLIVCTSKIESESGMWDVFGLRFTELEHIRFQPRRGRHIEQDPDIPEDDVLRKYFRQFPKLRKIVWVQNPWRKDDCVETVFTRRGKAEVLIHPGLKSPAA
ncbi:hypothetical protein Ocin01_05731 [Orchesella cincta]|uniref:Uncharacterized protein n=1 Tax=Orchesella cincta TaxID=48709 RepID=A0A1D2N6T3_ORCCI|nr:hypothetical protein Ocin01_05731 [Orchesella cincta]